MTLDHSKTTKICFIASVHTIPTWGYRGIFTAIVVV